jgi:hypothetical protein
VEGSLEIAMKKIDNLESAFKSEKNQLSANISCFAYKRSKSKLQKEQLNMIPLQIL